MIDPVSIAIAAAVFAAGWLVGRHGRLRALGNQKPVEVKPICMCGHHYGTHDPTTGVCGAESKQRFQEYAGGDYGDVWVRCPCVRYTGPQPVEQYWVAPHADMSIVTAPIDRSSE